MNKVPIPTSNEALIANTDEVWSVESILEENHRRMDLMNATFNPFTGENSIGQREHVKILDFPIPDMWLPIEMMNTPLVRLMCKHGLYGFIERNFGIRKNDAYQPYINAVLDIFDRMRNRADYAYWCWMRALISQKGGGDDIRFRLNYPQRILMETWLEMERLGLPVRIDLLKARQWGGSTCVQIKFGHIQLVATTGANSIIVGHVKDASTEVKDMYFKLINKYPAQLLYKPGEEYNPKLPPIHGTSSSANLFYIDSRNCKLKLGSAERPESARGGDSTLAHCTEVAMWVATEGKTPEDIVRSVTGGISYKPGTVIIFESTANGTDNFFHDEYISAKQARELGMFHQYRDLFISWDQIGWKNMLPFKDDERYLKKNILANHGLSSDADTHDLPWLDNYLPESIQEFATTEREFAEKLLSMREQQTPADDRHEPGRYLWWLWQKGCSLQAIFWYTVERTKFHDHADMAAEAPSDDIEAFKHSGAKVFSEYHVRQFESSCKPPKYIGEVDCNIIVSDDDMRRFSHRMNDAFSGKQRLSNLKFREDPQGNLWVWDLPEYFTDCKVKNRYLVVVDIGGMSNRADFSVIVVFDRYWMTEGDGPVVVAQWYGHIDHDILAWKSAQIAKFYDNALLVIESNTLETRDREREVDGDQSQFVLNQIKECYPNLYERKADETAILDGIPHRYGFHTNVQTKPMIIANLVKCLRDHLYVERDKRCLDEYMVYERKPNGSFGASSKHHDDLLMTRAIGLHICFNEMPYPKIIQAQEKQKSIKAQDVKQMSAAVF